MTKELGSEVLGQLGMPAIFLVLLIYFAVKLLVFKDVDSIRPAQWKPLKKEYRDAYAKEAGILVLAFGACSLVSAIIMLFVVPVGLIVITLGIIGVFYQFRRLEEKYT